MLTIEIIATATGKCIKRCAFEAATVSDRAAVFLSFLNYWERHFGQQTDYTWRTPA
ncbi:MULTISPECIES: hypothetical protein [unclassified Bradyrhizobium]|uniref:hypothetical protein n=1 Tax=Bradyrhizobium sp. USDA 4541 TaxID=2817704 RepID=UPI0020A2E187|nr:hypothetical protein [Bradyrhizobium sp. USDA 4541]MCP1852825.1 hypothetical protein [Bradyrhizobium sp. USDA 4541]